MLINETQIGGTTMLNIDYDKLNIETLGSLDLINKAQHDGTKVNVLNLIRHYKTNNNKPTYYRERKDKDIWAVHATDWFIVVNFGKRVSYFPHRKPCGDYVAKKELVKNGRFVKTAVRTYS